MAFARAVGEIGAVVLITGNTAKTQVASIYIFDRIENFDAVGASAVSIVLLGTAFLVLLAVGAVRRYATRFERA
jgi:sulfate transport system permease protein